MPDITFFNVAITVSAKTPEAAYDQLCGLLARGGADADDCPDLRLEYETDTYSVDGGPRRPTAELWPHRPPTTATQDGSVTR